MRRPAVWIGWILARLMLWWLIWRDQRPFGDVRYYFNGVTGLDPAAMTEYPDAGVWPVRLLALVTGDNWDTFRWGFVVMCLVIDAAFLALILSRPDRNRLTAGWFWVFFGVALGHVFYLRLDLFPGLLVAAFGALLFRHPAWASVALAVATAVKLWPGVLAASLVGGLRRAGTWIRLLAFFGSLAAIALATVATSGVGRLISPLTYQGDRGLQIESLAATPFMLDAHRNPADYWIGYAASKSFEIHGAATERAVTAVDTGMLLVLGFAVLLAAAMMLTDRWHPRSALAFALLLVLLLIVTNKVFSPQYLVWIAPLLAVCLCVSGDWQVRAMAVLTVIAAGLTFGVYPVHYDVLHQNITAAGLPLALLAARNSLVVVLTVLSAWWLGRVVFKELRQRGGAAEPQRTHRRA